MHPLFLHKSIQCLFYQSTFPRLSCNLDKLGLLSQASLMRRVSLPEQGMGPSHLSNTSVSPGLLPYNYWLTDDYWMTYRQVNHSYLLHSLICYWVPMKCAKLRYQWGQSSSFWKKLWRRVFFSSSLHQLKTKLEYQIPTPSAQALLI